MGPDVTRVATDGDRWAICIVHPGRTLVPAGDPGLIARLGFPSRRWRMIIGDVAACRPLLDPAGLPDGVLVHHQRFMLVDLERVPDVAALPDPGIRAAEAADLDGLVDLAVQLHLDDEFGPVSGAIRRGYRARMQGSIDSGLLRVVGPVGAPVAKLERAVASARRGVQLAGIVVTPPARSQGLGRAFVAAAVREARSQAGGLPDLACTSGPRTRRRSAPTWRQDSWMSRNGAWSCVPDPEVRWCDGLGCARSAVCEDTRKGASPTQWRKPASGRRRSSPSAGASDCTLPGRVLASLSLRPRECQHPPLPHSGGRVLPRTGNDLVTISSWPARQTTHPRVTATRQTTWKGRTR